MSLSQIKVRCNKCGGEHEPNVKFCPMCGTGLAPTCGTCGHSVIPGHKFCSQCGSSLQSAQSCCGCGNSLLPETRFCSQCGTPATPGLKGVSTNSLLESLQPAPMPPPPVVSSRHRERREITVLVLDVTNFTEVSHRLDSEEVYFFINEAMQAFVEIIKRYEGVVDKFTGDGLMALFGAPIAHENDPELAVRAGLEMQQVLEPLQQDLREKLNFSLQIRIGIHTGNAIAGSLGSDLHTEYTVIGETVEIASGLEGAAEPGTVLVSDETYRRTRPLFHYHRRDNLNVGGSALPVTGYCALGLRTVAESVRGLPGLQAPMIGRSNELDDLKQAVESVRETQQSHLVCVSGEAGLGKSRLLREFRTHLDESGIFHVQGVSFPHTRAIAYAAIAHMLLDLLDLSENESPGKRSEALLRYLERRGLDGPQIGPYLFYLLGLEIDDPHLRNRLEQLDAQMLQRQTYVAVHRILFSQVRRNPSVLIFDDLHWIDPASRDLLAALMRATTDLPLLIILISRPLDEKSPVAGLIETGAKELSGFQSIELKALEQDDAVCLVDSYIDSSKAGHEQVSTKIVERAEGNPFYIEELVRMLLDRKGLIEEGERLVPTSSVNELLGDVPGSLGGLILARFDALGNEERGVLQKAVALGRSFPVALLEQLCKVPGHQLQELLESLECRLFLRAEPFGREQGFTFRHTLVQEAVYRTLLKQDRRAIHDQVATTIETGNYYSGDERTEALAYHFAESNQPAAAVPYLIQSAETAAERSAHETALTRYRKALEILESAPDRVGISHYPIRIGLGKTLKYSGALTDAMQNFASTVEKIEAEVDFHHEHVIYLVESLTELGDIQVRAGQFDKALDSLSRALTARALHRERIPKRLWHWVTDRLAMARLHLGQLDEAADLALEAIDQLETSGTEDTSLLASLYNILGGVYYQKGMSARAIGYVRRSLKLYEALDYSWGIGSTLNNLGILYYTQGLWSDAAEHYEQADDIRRKNGFITERAVSLYNLALLRLAMGEHEKATAHFNTSIDIGLRMSDFRTLAGCYIGLGQIAAAEDDVERLAELIEIAHDYSNSMGEVYTIQLRLLETQLIRRRGAIEEAINNTKCALDAAVKAGLSEEEIDAYRVLGSLHVLADSYCEAEKSLRRSVELCRKRKDPYRLGLGLLELSRLYSEAPSVDCDERKGTKINALSVLEEAATHLEEVGAAFYLREAGALRTRLEAEKSSPR